MTGTETTIAIAFTRDEWNTIAEILAEAIERDAEEDGLGHIANYLGAIRDDILRTPGVH